MKNKLLFIVFLLTSQGLLAQFNAGLGADTNFDSYGIRGLVHYTVDDQWAGQVSGSIYLNNSNPSMLNFDAHYTLLMMGDVEDIKLKAIGGFNYWSIGLEGAGGELGVNLGANLEFPLTESLDAFIEPKITLVSIADFFLSFGVYF